MSDTKNPSLSSNELCVTAIALVHKFKPSMHRGHRYTLETMCGNAFWDSLNPVQRTKVGRCIACLVAKGELGLIFADIGKKATKQYQLK